MKKVKRTVDAWLGRISGRAATPSNCFYHRHNNVETIFHYLRDLAGFEIQVKPGVSLDMLRFPENMRLLNDEHALAVLTTELAVIGCTVLRRGRTLTIITTQEAKKNYIPLPTIIVGQF